MTTRDLEIVTSLSAKVRYFSLGQIARTWWVSSKDGISLARKRLLRLVAEGWLKRSRVLARPLLKLERPVFQWSPEDAAPDFRAVSRILRGRWKMPARETELFLGTPQARTVLGGAVPHVVKNLCQTTHDLHVSEMFLHYRELIPDIFATWVGEDEMTSRGQTGTVPDAHLRTDDGGIWRLIEFGGSYSQARVAEFHAFCSANSFIYEMW